MIHPDLNINISRFLDLPRIELCKIFGVMGTNPFLTDTSKVDGNLMDLCDKSI